MNTTVAIAAIVSRTAIILAGIHYGVRFFTVLLPQLRVTGPPKPQADPNNGTPPPPATTGDQG